MKHPPSLKIGIIGFGYVGQWLKKALDSSSFTVVWTHRTPQTSDPREIILDLDKTDPLPLPLLDCHVLYFLLPPGSDSEHYAERVTRFSKDLKDHQKVIMVSSTSVFSGKQLMCSEETLPKPESSRGQNILNAENSLLKLKPNSLIVRSGGQIGPDRLPAKSLARRGRLPAGNHPVNVIHILDLVRVLCLPLYQNVTHHYLHGVSPYHPTKEHFYQHQAKRLGLDIGVIYQSEDQGKTINSRYLAQLGFSFINPFCEEILP